MRDPPPCGPRGRQSRSPGLWRKGLQLPAAPLAGRAQCPLPRPPPSLVAYRGPSLARVGAGGRLKPGPPPASGPRAARTGLEHGNWRDVSVSGGNDQVRSLQNHAGGATNRSGHRSNPHDQSAPARRPGGTAQIINSGRAIAAQVPPLRPLPPAPACVSSMVGRHQVRRRSLLTSLGKSTGKSHAIFPLAQAVVGQRRSAEPAQRRVTIAPETH